MQPVIVGIDPGITCAFAVLDFDFNVLKVMSKRNFSLNELISEVYKAGSPIVVGTDKKEIPNFIKEFSQKTGARIHITSYDTKKGEKKNIVDGHDLLKEVRNVHETDALASAIYAFNDCRPLLNKISKFVKMENKHDLRYKLIIKMISEGKSLKNAVDELEFRPAKQVKEVKPMLQIEKREVSKEEKEIILLKHTMKQLRMQIKELMEENDILKNKRVDIDKEIVKILSNKEKRAMRLEEQNRQLAKSLRAKDKIIKRLDEFIARSQDSVLIKKLDNLGLEEYRRKSRLFGIKKGDYLLVDDASIAGSDVIKDLAEKVNVILFQEKSSTFLSEKFLLVKRDGLNLFETKHFALANKEQLDSQIKKASEASKKDKRFIGDILEEYKRERLRDMIK